LTTLYHVTVSRNKRSQSYQSQRKMAHIRISIRDTLLDFDEILHMIRVARRRLSLKVFVTIRYDTIESSAEKLKS